MLLGIDLSRITVPEKMRRERFHFLTMTQIRWMGIRSFLRSILRVRWMALSRCRDRRNSVPALLFHEFPTDVRVRYLTDGAIFGGERFVERAFQRNRDVLAGRSQSRLRLRAMRDSR